jgi:hypothetical protein
MAYKILETIFVSSYELNTENPTLMSYICKQLHEGSNHIKFIKIHRVVDSYTNVYLIEYNSVRSTNSYMPAGFFRVDEDKLDLILQYFLP